MDAHAEDVDTYEAFAASKKMTVTHVIDTHLALDRAAFIVKLTNVPEKPPEMERILAFNTGR